MVQCSRLFRLQTGLPNRDQNSHKHTTLKGIAGFILPPGGHIEDLQSESEMGVKFLQYDGGPDRCDWPFTGAHLISVPYDVWVLLETVTLLIEDMVKKYELLC